MLEDVIQDVKKIKDDVVAVRIEIEKSKTVARFAWVAFTFCIGIASYYLRDYISHNVNNMDKIEAVSIQNSEQIALMNQRLSLIETKVMKDERDTKNVSYKDIRQDVVLSHR